ncbi:major Facilitator Superfamily protein [Asticcacaulis biprosthecium C19]|uniref:Major Facilitator Superfamily protein n=1 Tax=Asticcacaulis biprosthecium C19 TaxID=715226 RepID=F4QNW0_9CAUL|nr:MFS transporter [Asticcacaulis biprosthecium]EGF91018.1 major Facilitator Superfamily protein [Asticcacaulis biprosthecium C19]
MTQTQTGEGTAAQGLLLCLLSTLSVAAALLIAPVLPAIAAAFPDDPMAQTKSILALAVPALVVALTAPLAGWITDKAGRKGVLLLSLVIYLVCGLAPFFLTSLDHIILSRVGVGLAESGFMTASTTLLGDYFKGARRENWLVVQTGTASVAAVVLVAIGGVLGEFGWRVPFMVYGLGLLFIPLVMLLISEPKHEVSETRTRFPLGKVFPLYVIGLFAATLFFLIPIQTPFLLTERGMGAPQMIGLTSAIGGIAVPVGGLIFKLTARWKLSQHLVLAFVMIAGGLFLFVGDGSYPVTCAGIVITGLGCGITLPAVLTAIMARLDFAQRGAGTGGWQTAFFLGNFISPVLVLALTAQLHGLGAAIQALGAAAVAAAVLSLIAALLPRSAAKTV